MKGRVLNILRIFLYFRTTVIVFHLFLLFFTALYSGLMVGRLSKVMLERGAVILLLDIVIYDTENKLSICSSRID